MNTATQLHAKLSVPPQAPPSLAKRYSLPFSGIPTSWRMALIMPHLDMTAVKLAEQPALTNASEHSIPLPQMSAPDRPELHSSRRSSYYITSPDREALIIPSLLQPHPATPERSQSLFSRLRLGSSKSKSTIRQPSPLQKTTSSLSRFVGVVCRRSDTEALTKAERRAAEAQWMQERSILMNPQFWLIL